MKRGWIAIATFVAGTALLLGAHEMQRRPEAQPDVTPAEKVRVDPGATVLAFLDTHSTERAADNRSQAVVVRSLHEQYAKRGIEVLIVAPALTAGENADARLTTRYNWGLGELTFLPDDNGQLAAGYSVDQFPTTVLVDSDGLPIAVWEGYSPPGELGPVLEQLCSPDRNEG